MGRFVGCGARRRISRARHRHLKAPKAVQPASLAGIVEADETYFLVSAKGSRKLVGRAARTRGGTASKPGLSDQHTAVLMARDRHGATLGNVLLRSEASLKPHLGPVLARDCLLVSDGAKAYGALARSLEIGQVGLNTSAGAYVKDGIHLIQNVNAWTSGLKAWMARFNGVATKNLPTYLGWRRMITAASNARTTEDYLMAAVA